MINGHPMADLPLQVGHIIDAPLFRRPKRLREETSCSNQLCSMTYNLQTYPFVANQYGHAHPSVLDIQVRNAIHDGNNVGMAVI
jgi:hypothetical protein